MRNLAIALQDHKPLYPTHYIKVTNDIHDHYSATRITDASALVHCLHTLTKLGLCSSEWDHNLECRSLVSHS